jgi:Rieske Fe-S protein
MNELKTDVFRDDENSADANENRRRFLKKSLLGIGIFVTGIIVAILKIPLISSFFNRSRHKWIEIDKTSGFRTGQPRNVMISYEKIEGWYRSSKKELVLVVKQSSNKESFVAFSSSCPHLGCTVQWDDKKERFLCPCHGGSFDIDGNVLTGPPPKPLERYTVKVSQDKLFILKRS